MSRATADFTDTAAADAFHMAREHEGFECVTTFANLPRPGCFQVAWGHREPERDAHVESMRLYARILDERQQRADDAFEATCRGIGREMAAEEFAQTAGLAGRDAEVFIAGFRGWCAKVVNPRAEGREPVFRAGRSAWGSAEGQRAYRRHSVAARSLVQREAPSPFHEGGLIANGEH